jgi:polyisoprenoid-binding protein YceI
MRRPLHALIAALILLIPTVGPALAKPVPYQLSPDASIVGFEADFGADKIHGQFPVTAASVAIDFQDLAKTTVNVSLDAASAVASFPFAAQAMKGPKVLDTHDFPTITFRSTKVTADGDAARIDGAITIRGQTRPLTMMAQLYQVQGETPGDYRQLTITLTGALSRSAFGATGWADMVGDEVRIHVIARIDRTE